MLNPRAEAVFSKDSNLDVKFVATLIRRCGQRSHIMVDYLKRGFSFSRAVKNTFSIKDKKYFKIVQQYYPTDINSYCNSENDSMGRVMHILNHFRTAGAFRASTGILYVEETSEGFFSRVTGNADFACSRHVRTFRLTQKIIMDTMKNMNLDFPFTQILPLMGLPGGKEDPSIGYIFDCLSEPCGVRGDAFNIFLELGSIYNEAPNFDYFKKYYRHVALTKMHIRFRAVSLDNNNGSFIFSFCDSSSVLQVRSCLFSGRTLLKDFFVYTHVPMSVKVDQVGFLGAFSVQVSYELCASDTLNVVRLIKQKKSRYAKSVLHYFWLTCSYKVLYYDVLDENGYYNVRPKDAVRTYVQQMIMIDNLMWQMRLKIVKGMCCICLERRPQGGKFVNPTGSLECGHIVCRYCFLSAKQGDWFICPLCRKLYKLPDSFVVDHHKNSQIQDTDFCEFCGELEDDVFNSSHICTRNIKPWTKPPQVVQLLEELYKKNVGGFRL